MLREVAPASFVAGVLVAYAATYALVWHPSYQRRHAPIGVQRIVPSFDAQRASRDEWVNGRFAVEYNGQRIQFGHLVNESHNRLPDDFYRVDSHLSLQQGTLRCNVTLASRTLDAWLVQLPVGSSYNVSTADDLLVSFVPHHFGAQDHVLLQVLTPTRTGLQHLRSSSVVWAVG